MHLIDLKTASGRRFNAGTAIGGSDRKKLPKVFTGVNKFRICNDSDSIFTASYFLGLLEPVFDRFKTACDFYDGVAYEELHYTNKQELHRAVKRRYNPLVL